MPSLLWVNHFALAPTDDGGTRHFELARQLARRGWSVSIAAADYHVHRRTYTRRAGAHARGPIRQVLDDVSFHWLWSAPYQRNDWRRGWNWLSFARSLLSWSRQQPRPDIVIGSSPHLLAALAANRAARGWNCPFVFEVRDLWPESLVAAGGHKGPMYFGLGAIAERLYARADRIMCLASGSVGVLERRGIAPEKLLFVPNGVNSVAMAAEERPRRSTFTAVYAGAHGPANGLDVVLEAASLLHGYPHVRFLLVGDGPAKAELRTRAEALALENVAFMDPVPKENIKHVLQGADAGLMILRDTPLFAYGVSPNKLFDYFAAGLPVVCNVGGETAEMVRSAGAGELAEPGSAASLADAILRLAGRDPAERSLAGQSGRTWVARERDWTVLAERLERHLEELLV